MKHPHCLSVMVSDDERRRIEAAALKDGRSRSDWLRRAAIEKLEREKQQ